MSHASQNVLAQIMAYMANAHNEQRRSQTGSCELSRLGSSKAASASSNEKNEKRGNKNDTL
ncbi:MAG TPA: hypothetical protein DCR83_07075 [Eubacterium sp.]|nr:hypothetical protein [Eubacterium sp.]HCO35355.1 hypothetical protein [Eubacterium sp.]